MDRSRRAVSRTLYGLVIGVVGQLLFDGLDMFSIRSEGLRIAEVLLAIVLLFGIIPGSFLSVVIRRLGARAGSISIARTRLIAIGIPLLLVAIQTYYIIGDLGILQRISDPRVRTSMIYGLVMGLFQLAILIMNANDLARLSHEETEA